MAQGLETVAGLRRRAVALCAGLGVAALGLVLPASTIAAQVEPPQRGAPFESVWFSVGDVREVDASSAFVGSVDSYTATSDNGAAVSASVAGSVVRLTGLTAGVAFVEVRASNAGGSASQWIGVISRATEPLASASAAAAERTPDDSEDMLPVEDDDPPPDVGDAVSNESDRSVVGDDASSPTTALVAQAWCFTREMHGMFHGGVRRSPSARPQRGRTVLPLLLGRGRSASVCRDESRCPRARLFGVRRASDRLRHPDVEQRRSWRADVPGAGRRSSDDHCLGDRR